MHQVPSPVLNQPTDDELMDLTQKGHRDSFAAIFNRHGLSVLRYARMLTGSLADAQDLTQEVFLKAYAQRMAYRKMGIMKHWLFTICRHLHIDQQRRRVLRAVPMDPQDISDQVMTQPEACSQELKEHFFSHHMIGGFPQETKEVLFLRIVEELSYREIADLTGITIEALRQVVSRALQTIRERVEVTA